MSGEGVVKHIAPTLAAPEEVSETSLINEIFADAAFILRRECMGS